MVFPTFLKKFYFYIFEREGVSQRGRGAEGEGEWLFSRFYAKTEPHAGLISGSRDHALSWNQESDA